MFLRKIFVLSLYFSSGLALAAGPRCHMHATQSNYHHDFDLEVSSYVGDDPYTMVFDLGNANDIFYTKGGDRLFVLEENRDGWDYSFNYRYLMGDVTLKSTNPSEQGEIRRGTLTFRFDYVPPKASMSQGSDDLDYTQKVTAVLTCHI